MRPERTVSGVLANYQVDEVRAVVPLGGMGGFSGAAFWRIETPAATWCLRRWPHEHPSPQRLADIHAVLQHVAGSGFAKLPVPLASRHGSSFISAGGFLWQLEPWIPGEANYRQSPSRRKLVAAMRALAQFHQAAASFERAHGPASGISLRREQLDNLRAKQAATISAALGRATWLAERGRQILGYFRQQADGLQQILKAAERQPVPLQPCIRDIWHDHVFFVDEEVSGFVDFGALKRDHVAADISRLLGSLVGDDAELRQCGLDAYQSVRPLSTDDRWLIEVFARSSTLLAGMNWLKWICVDGREFDDRQRVLGRIYEIIARLTPRGELLR